MVPGTGHNSSKTKSTPLLVVNAGNHERRSSRGRGEGEFGQRRWTGEFQSHHGSHFGPARSGPSGDDRPTDHQRNFNVMERDKKKRKGPMMRLKLTSPSTLTEFTLSSPSRTAALMVASVYY